MNQMLHQKSQKKKKLNIIHNKHMTDSISQQKVVGPNRIIRTSSIDYNTDKIVSDISKLLDTHMHVPSSPLSLCRAGPRANRSRRLGGCADGKETMDRWRAPTEPAPVGAVGGRVLGGASGVLGNEVLPLPTRRIAQTRTPSVPGAAPKREPNFLSTCRNGGLEVNINTQIEFNQIEDIIRYNKNKEKTYAM